MNKLRVGVVGAGAMGRSHVRVYSEMEDANLVAVCDNNNEQLEKINEKLDMKKYNDVNKMIKKEKLDAVSVCVPTKFHKDVASKFINNGINVLIEKPLASDAVEGEEIVKKAKEKNVKLFVGHIERFNPCVIELKKKIANNELGKIYKVHCTRMSPFPQRVVDVGVIIDLAIHEIDIIKYLIDAKIRKVYAETAQRIHSEHEDLMMGILKLDNDVLGIIDVNWVTPRKIREITITGEKGMLKANYLTQDIVFYENDFMNKKFEYSKNVLMSIIEGKSYPIKIKKKEPLNVELSSFVECIRKNTDPEVSGQDGVEALKVAEKFMKSSKENGVFVL
jgi:predicted dehydrogenase